MAKKNSRIKFKTKGQKWVTGKVYLLFPSLEKPSQFDEDAELKYSVTILMDKDSKDVKNIKEIISSEWLEGSIKKGAHDPLKDGDVKKAELEKEDKNGDIYENRYYIRSSSKFEVKVVDANKRLWTGTDQEINGFIGRVHSLVRAYEAGINSGVTLYLKGVQVISKGLEIGGDTTADFDVEETEEDDNDPFGNDENNQKNNEKLNKNDKKNEKLNKNQQELPDF